MIDIIKKNMQTRAEGKFIGIPIYKTFPKLENDLPAIPPGAMLLISAATGIGKSKFARFLIISIYDIYKNHVDSGKDPGFIPEFLIFLTEESKQEFILGLTSILIYKKYRYNLGRLQLLSMKRIPLSSNELKMVEGVQGELNELLSFIKINDSIYHPYGIYYQCREYSKEVGTHYYTDLKGETGKYLSHNEFDALKKEKQKEFKYSHYEQKDKEKQRIVLVDNLNNLSLEQSHNGNLRNAINDWSRKYAKQNLSIHWKWIVLNVIQQGMDTEKKQFTNAGSSIIEKLKPSIAGLGNSRECARDHEAFIGLFKPAKYGVKKYEGYDTSKNGFHTSYISLIFEKNRLGQDTFELSVYFNGAAETFKELPPADVANELIHSQKEDAKR